MPARTILVIDEDEDIRIIMGELLRHAGYAPIAAPTPEEGIRLFQEKLPALVVVEPYTFGRDRWSEIASLAASGRVRETPLLAVSTQAQEAADARDAGCARFLAKPVSPVLILGAIEGLLGHAP